MGVKGKGLEDIGEWFIAKTNAYLLRCTLEGSEQIQANLKRRRTTRSPPSSAGACGAERTAPCVRLE